MYLEYHAYIVIYFRDILQTFSRYIYIWLPGKSRDCVCLRMCVTFQSILNINFKNFIGYFILLLCLNIFIKFEYNKI